MQTVKCWREEGRINGWLHCIPKNKCLRRTSNGWLKNSPKERERREEGRRLIGWLKCQPKVRFWILLGRWSTFWKKIRVWREQLNYNDNQMINM